VCARRFYGLSRGSPRRKGLSLVSHSKRLSMSVKPQLAKIVALPRIILPFASPPVRLSQPTFPSWASTRTKFFSSRCGGLSWHAERTRNTVLDSSKWPTTRQKWSPRLKKTLSLQNLHAAYSRKPGPWPNAEMGLQHAPSATAQKTAATPKSYDVRYGADQRLAPKEEIGHTEREANAVDRNSETSGSNWHPCFLP
jgi:hypothetical protein